MSTDRVRNPRGQGERLREDLLDSASRLLEAAPGEQSLSLRAVAAGAGVAAPSLYRHFADRGELMLAVLQRRFAELSAALDAAEYPGDDPRTALRARCLAFCGYAAAHPGPYRVMFEAVPSTPPPPGLDLVGAGLVDDLAARIARCTGDDEHDPGVRRRAFVLWSALHGLAVLPTSKPAVAWPDVDALVDELLTRLGLADTTANG